MSAAESQLPATQRISNTVYRALAKLVGGHIGSSEVVRSVFARRSLAAGEISFARSDIDLTIVLSDALTSPAGVAALASLAASVSRLRSFLPVLGECEVFAPGELARWSAIEPFRASLNRRAMILLHGDPVAIPEIPVERQDGIRLFLFWLEKYFPQAVQRRNVRNLRKFAVEMWNAYTTAVSAMPWPFVSRRLAEAAWRAAEPGSHQVLLSRDTTDYVSLCFHLAGRLHERFLRPLGRLPGPMVFTATLAPELLERTFVVLPAPDAPLPAAADEPNAFLCTPEVLDLYAHHMNPFVHAILPPELTELGIERPSWAAFVRAGRYFSAPNRTRRPGFVSRGVDSKTRAIHTISQAAATMARGSLPRTLDSAALEGAWSPALNCNDYYRRCYPSVYRRAARAWNILDGLTEASHHQ